LTDGARLWEDDEDLPPPGNDNRSRAFMEGKTVFITGGAGGLGASAARYLAERSWQVFAADSDEAALHGMAQESRVTPVRLDVTDPASVEAVRGIVGGASTVSTGL
jgi:NADP-dependent 3-hydroxy acid dehydrogenase YdfG